MEDKIKKYIWGTIESLDIEHGNCTNKITVLPKQKMPLQKTLHERLHWVLIVGAGLVFYDGQSFVRNCGESVDILPGVAYCISNEQEIELKFIEICVNNPK